MADCYVDEKPAAVLGVVRTTLSSAGGLVLYKMEKRLLP
jgi:hypothetical protein